jgi:hypothetical protein
MEDSSRDDIRANNAAFTAEYESLGSNRHNSGSSWPANPMEEDVL